MVVLAVAVLAAAAAADPLFRECVVGVGKAERLLAQWLGVNQI